MPAMMTMRMLKIAAVVLLGFAMAFQGPASTSPRAAQSGCCCAGCDFKGCATPACCVQPIGERGPTAPAALPLPQQQELQALAVPISAAVSAPLIPANSLPLTGPCSIRFALVPIFQRDCSYLL